jgi:dihydrofolate reductase
LHVVASLDGFIARSDNSLAWIDGQKHAYAAGIPENSPEVEDIVRAIECFVLGSHTYEHALQLGWPYGDTPTVVVTARDFRAERSSVEFYSGDLERLVREVLAPRYGNIWLVGGASLCQSFLRLDLVDEIRLSIVPSLLGRGLRLFGEAEIEQRWTLKDVLAFRNGFVELVYGRESAVSEGEPMRP